MLLAIEAPQKRAMLKTCTRSRAVRAAEESERARRGAKARPHRRRARRCVARSRVGSGGGGDRRQRRDGGRRARARARAVRSCDAAMGAHGRAPPCDLRAADDGAIGAASSRSSRPRWRKRSGPRSSPSASASATASTHARACRRAATSLRGPARSASPSSSSTSAVRDPLGVQGVAGGSAHPDRDRSEREVAVRPDDGVARDSRALRASRAARR